MKRLLVGIAAGVLAVLGVFGLRRRYPAGTLRRGDDGGGLAGDREPRVPLPVTPGRRRRRCSRMSRRLPSVDKSE